MKTKHTVITVIAALGLAATLFAAEQQKANTTKVITLKSHGVAIAELRVLKSQTLQIFAGNQNANAQTGVLTAKGAVTIQLGSTGDSPVTIKADEAEVVSVAK